MHKNFNICLLNPVFEDISKLIKYGLTQLGHNVNITQFQLENNAINIILGANEIKKRFQINKHNIIVNFEQLGTESLHIPEIYYENLRRHTVWDYSKKNIDYLNRLGVHPSHFKIGFSPELIRVDHNVHKDIDVLFYGTLNDRRQSIIDLLINHGLNVLTISNGIILKDLDKFIARSKIVLNIHYYPTEIFEIVRVGYLLNNGVAVVSEINKNTEIEPELLPAIHPSCYDNLVKSCLNLLSNPKDLLSLRNRAFDIYSKRNQSTFLKDLIF